METKYSRLTPDQAVTLRLLVQQARAVEGEGAAPSPSSDEQTARGGLIVVAGAKGGVGVTTLSLRLAEALAHVGRKAVLIDANLRQADLAHVAGAAGRGGPDLSDVLSGACRTEDALTALAENLSLLPGVWAPSEQPDATTEGVRRWLSEISGLVESGASLIVDAGAGMRPWTEPLWRRATRVMLVTTEDNIAVLDAYAATKLARGQGMQSPIDLLVNRVPDSSRANDVHTRVDQTCQRFLGKSVGLLGWAPQAEEIAACGLSPQALTHTSEWPLTIGQSPLSVSY